MAAATNLSFLMLDEVLAGAIIEMIRTSEDFKIMRDPNDPNNNQADPDDTQRKGKGTTIYWSGVRGLAYDNMTEEERSLVVAPFASLAHELIGHGWIRFKGLERADSEIVGTLGPPGFSFIPKREIDAVNIENRANMIENNCLASPPGYPPCSSLRTKYNGRDISPYLDFEDFLGGKNRSPRKPPKLKRPSN